MYPIATTFTDDQDWLADQRKRAESDRFLIAIPLFLATAHFPETP
jgi:hypothetical protein